MANFYPYSEKLDMWECYIKSNKNKRNASVLYEQQYPERQKPHFSIFPRLEKNMLLNGSFNVSKKRQKTVSTEDQAINVLALLNKNHGTSLRTIAGW